MSRFDALRMCPVMSMANQPPVRKLHWRVRTPLYVSASLATRIWASIVPKDVSALPRFDADIKGLHACEWLNPLISRKIEAREEGSAIAARFCRRYTAFGGVFDEHA